MKINYLLGIEKKYDECAISLGCYYFGKKNKFDKALKYFKLAKKYYTLKGTNKKYLNYNIGLSYKEIKNFEYAEKYFLLEFENDHYKDLDKNSEELYEMLEELGEIYEITNNVEKLLQLYQNYNMKEEIFNKLNELFIKNSDLDKMSREVLDIFLEIDLENLKFDKDSEEDVPVALKIMQNLLKEKIELMDLHFNYSEKGKGFDDAKNDFYKRIIHKN